LPLQGGGAHSRWPAQTLDCQLQCAFISAFIFLCAGGVPGPILFGFALDHSCLLWEQKCDGSTGACLYYDNHQMAWLLLAVCASCKVLNIVCGLLSWQLYVHKYSRGNRSPKQTAVEYMLSLDEPVNGQTQNSLYGSTENMVAEVDRDQAGAVSNPAEEAETSD